MPARSSSSNKVYKFVQTTDVIFGTDLYDVEYTSEWLDIRKNGEFVIKGSNKSGYAWDGCSIKWNSINVTWGTPDGKLDYTTLKQKTYYASMLHDVLYENKKTVPVSRKNADLLFKDILKTSNYILSPIYYAAVRIFGGLFGAWKTKSSEQKRIKLVSLRYVRSGSGFMPQTLDVFEANSHSNVQT